MLRVVFNRTPPSPLGRGWSGPARFHLQNLRPCACLFRLMTYRLRVLPDVIVLGEVRCGTTTLCHQLRACAADPHNQSQSFCHSPFSLWDHPELGDKETFYFVGHLLGVVDPQIYAAFFPLALTKWFQTRILGNKFFTFDGCAQYLTSPSAPHLIAAAYRGRDPPVLVACTRNPVEQTASWWKFENDFMVSAHIIIFTRNS